jgi:spermidine/putrescine-binding protein
MKEKDKRDLNILVPIEAKPRLDYLHSQVERMAGMRVSRRQALGLGGLAVVAAIAAACGKTTTTTTGSGTTSTGPAGSGDGSLKGQPLESKLEFYNWSQYDAKSTFTGFENQPAEKAVGMNTHETFYSSNDELLAKLNAGAGGYDIIVPSQNAVAQLIDEGKLMAMDHTLLPNLKYLDPAFLKPSYDPTGDYHVIKDYGITMFFYNNKIVTEKPANMKDFYGLLTKYVHKGRTNVLDGAEEVVPLALMALGLDPIDLASHTSVSQPQVLDRLAHEFAAHDYDLKSVIRWVVLSDPFTRSSKLTDLATKDMPEAGELALFSRCYSRPTKAESVPNALTKAAQIRKASKNQADVVSARRDWLMQASRGPATDSGQKLMDLSGPIVPKAFAGPQGELAGKIAASQMPFDKKVEHFFLSALSRQPSGGERRLAATMLQNAKGDQTAALEDVWWAILNSDEAVLMQ